MASIVKNHYNNVTRWDLITKIPSIKKSVEVPQLKMITVQMHESHPKSSKEAYILAFCLEILTGQRVSPTILSKKSYKNFLAPKKLPAIHLSQVSLRQPSMYIFLDKWLMFFPTKNLVYNPLLGLYNSDSKSISCYQTNTLRFPEWQQIATHLHKLGPLQLNIIKK